MRITIPRPTWIVFFACAVHWVWGCSLLFSPEPSRIAAWDSFSYLSNFLLGLMFMTVATLGYAGLFKERSAWFMLPQQIVLSITAWSQTHLIAEGHYADWVIRPPFFIFRDQVWGILLALFHLAGMLMIAYSHHPMQKSKFHNFIKYPFETGVAIYTVVNALLTFSPESAVLSSLWQLIGGYTIVAVCYQLFAACSIIYGLASRKINVEIMGLVMLCSTYAIRAVALLTDGDIILSDINSSVLAGILIVSSAVRIWSVTTRNPCQPQT